MGSGVLRLTPVRYSRPMRTIVGAEDARRFAQTAGQCPVGVPHPGALGVFSREQQSVMGRLAQEVEVVGVGARRNVGIAASGERVARPIGDGDRSGLGAGASDRAAQHVEDPPDDFVLRPVVNMAESACEDVEHQRGADTEGRLIHHPERRLVCVRGEQQHVGQPGVSPEGLGRSARTTFS